jgi:ribosome-associated protein
MKAPLNELQQLVVDAATDKKAYDIIILDVRTRTALADYFMICSGRSKVQVKVHTVEGYSTGNWIIVDLGDLMVHVFHHETRGHYDLERLWGDVPIIAKMSGS